MTTDPGAPPLPGLDVVDDLAERRRGAKVSALEAAIRRSLAELHRQGHIGEVDAGKLQLAIELAQIIELKKATRRTSTVGNDARVLMEILDAFVDEATDVDDDLRDAMNQWSDYLAPDAAPPPAPDR